MSVGLRPVPKKWVTSCKMRDDCIIWVIARLTFYYLIFEATSTPITNVDAFD